MPQCTICNTAVWMGQQYCSTCDHPLPHPEQDDYLCPQCGIRLASPQEICQRCKDTPPEITGMLSTAPARAWRLPLGRRGLCLGAGLIIAALALVFLVDKEPVAPQLVLKPPLQAVSEQTPAAPAIPASEPAPSTATVAAVRELAVPSALAASSLPAVTTPTPSRPRYLVNIDGLSVRDGPETSAPRIATLNFKDEVELLDTSGGWGRVRDVKRNIVGWSYLRYLQPLAAAGPLAVSRHQASGLEESEASSAKAPEAM